MSQFNLYLERIQETRNYKYQDLELYDEGFKEIWDKMKDKLKSFGRYATIIGLLLSAGNFDSVKKDSIPEELKDAKSVLLKMIQNPKKTLSESDKETLHKAITYYNNKETYPDSDNWDKYIFDGSVPELITYLQNEVQKPEQVRIIIDVLNKQGPDRNVRPQIFKGIEGPNHKGL